MSFDSAFRLALTFNELQLIAYTFDILNVSVTDQGLGCFSISHTDWVIGETELYVRAV